MIHFKLILLIKLALVYVSGQNKSELIYILIWTPSGREPWTLLDRGQKPFIKRNCKFQNCFLTENREYFSNVTQFDVLLFNAVDFLAGGLVDAPSSRITTQEYVLVSTEPAARYPIYAHYNHFFNMTWTYKLGSDVVFPYIVVKDKNGQVIGPKKKMNWPYSMEDIKEPSRVMDRLMTKNIAAAIIMSNCVARNDRLAFVISLQHELDNYGHRADVYGTCGQYDCPRGEREQECYSKIEKDYYFYLAFENSYCDDYVSEKVLMGLNHFAVPVVLGGAKYERFMPDGIYLNAIEGPQEVARQMVQLIRDPLKYYSFFKWHGYYSFHHVSEDNYTATVCDFCALLNNKTRREQPTVYADIAKWWNKHYPHQTDHGGDIDDENSNGGFFQKLLSYFFGSR